MFGIDPFDKSISIGINLSTDNNTIVPIVSRLNNTDTSQLGAILNFDESDIPEGFNFKAMASFDQSGTFQEIEKMNQGLNLMMSF